MKASRPESRKARDVAPRPPACWIFRFPAFRFTLLAYVGWCLSAGSISAASRLSAKVDFNYQIKPLLSDRCYKCHGPDEKARKAKLRLDTSEGAFKALDDGMFVIKPGDTKHSELVRRITTKDPDDKMPPPESKLSLSADEIALLRRWIEQGAEWKKHWSFIPVTDVEVPAVRNAKWPRNHIDRFVLARLEREGLKPSPEASREHLIRRLSFDLTGLPPTLAEIDAFLADTSTQAYERVVDRLLASSAYGERMAVDWLDVARYADTYGYQADRFNHLWPWRDWVISAINRNIRINDFIVWQIAGDLLPHATREQRLATAFNRLHRQTNEGGSVEEEFRVEYNADRVHTMAGAFLGLTLECARCHDHKFDPITQKDYYRFFAFFNSTDESGLYSHFTDAIPSPTVLLYQDDAEQQKHREMKRAIEAKEEELAARRAAAGPDCERWRGRRGNEAEGFAPSSLTNPPPDVGGYGLIGLIGHYTFDSLTNNKAPNALGTNHPAKLSEAPRLVEGRFGNALQFSGENSVTIEKLADFKRPDPFSFSLWLKIAEELPEIVVLHHQQAGSDAGYHGYQLTLEDGHASFALVHFWPGNALKVRTKEKLTLHEWLHVGLTYDGSSRASGLKLFVNGKPAATEVVKDQLFKDFANGQPLTLAARFRGRGFKDGLIDDLRIFNRSLTSLEMESTMTADVSPSPLRGERAGVRGDPAHDQLLDYFLANIDEPSMKLRAELKKLRDEENNFINTVSEIMAMGDLPVPRPTYVLKRGAYDAHGDTVEPGTPDVLLPLDPHLPRNRLGLARWLVDPQNPLTARVLVNRAWQRFLGRGLVLTAENFGVQGALPSHPELLDWLAKHFMDTGWDLKALQKLIVMSATYRQSSQATPALLTRDSDNVLLARGPATRLTAEMLRDNALAASSLLVKKLGGPSVKPYQPEGLWEEKSSAWKYEPDKGDSLYRRSLYTYWKRTVPPPSMIVFDAAERNNCTVRRQSTSTPLQPLVLLNDPQFVEAARKLGERALHEADPSPDARITFAFRLLTSRTPTAKELAILRRLYDEQLASFRADGEGTASLLKVGEANSDPALNQAELAAATALASAILNFDEALLKR
jgi:hypothetical protein